MGSSVDVPCPAGYYCQAPTYASVACPVGHYCPTRTAFPIPCPANHTCGPGVAFPTLCPTTGCPRSCPAGQYIPTTQGGVCTDCPARKYCPVDMQTIAPIVCPPNFYCLVKTSVPIFCDGANVCQMPGGSPGKTSIAGSFSYVPAGNTEQGQCPAGFYCPGGLSWLVVQTYFNCSYIPGAYCPSGTSVPKSCPAGSYCSNSTTIALCPIGSYCPPGSVAPLPCGSNYCPMNSTWSPPCPEGSLPSLQNTSICVSCSMGSYTITTSSTCATCPNGQVTQAAGLNVCGCTSGKYKNSTAVLVNQVPAGGGQYESYCANCPAHSSAAFNAPAGFGQCACDAGYFGTMRASSSSSGDPDCFGGYCLKCISCPAGTYSAMWNTTSVAECLPCKYGTYSLPGSTTCSPCNVPTPLPGILGTDWRFKSLIDGSETTSDCPWICDNGALLTFDKYCMTPGQIDARCAQNCSYGDYSVGCGQGSNGTCHLCTGVCTEGTQYNVGCGGINPGTCKSCAPGGVCQTGEYLSSCGGTSWPQFSGACTSCMPIGCDAATHYVDDCTDNAPGNCKPCSTVCPVGQYVVGCGGVNSPGTCVSCDRCGSDSYARGCGGQSPGECTQCGSDCVNNQDTTTCLGGVGKCYTAGCGGSSPGRCATCDSSPHKYTTGCGIKSPGNTFMCGSDCPQGQYSLGCGGTSAGECTVCSNTAGPGYYFTGCSGDYPGDVLPCSIAGTHSPASGSTSCAACVGGTTNTPDFTACECPAGSFGNNVGCALCPAGYYQAYPGQASCTKCPLGTWSDKTGLSSEGGCILCPSSNKPVNSVWLDVVNTKQACAFVCKDGFSLGTSGTGATCIPTGGLVVVDPGIQVTARPVTPAPVVRGTTAAPPAISGPSTTPSVRPSTPSFNSSTPTSTDATTNVGLVVGLSVGGAVLFSLIGVTVYAGIVTKT